MQQAPKEVWGFIRFPEVFGSGHGGFVLFFGDVYQIYYVWQSIWYYSIVFNPIMLDMMYCGMFVLVNNLCLPAGLQLCHGISTSLLCHHG